MYLPDEIIELILSYSDERILDTFPEKLVSREYVVKHSDVLLNEPLIFIETPTRYYLLIYNSQIPCLILACTCDKKINLYYRNAYLFLKLRTMDLDKIPYKNDNIYADAVVVIDDSAYVYHWNTKTIFKIGKCQWVIFDTYCIDDVIYVGTYKTDIQSLVKIIPKFTVDRVKFINQEFIVFKDELNVIYSIKTGLTQTFDHNITHANYPVIAFDDNTYIHHNDTQKRIKPFYINNDGFIMYKDEIFHNINIFRHPSTWSLSQNDY